MTQTDRRSICGHSAHIEARLTALHARLFSHGSQSVQDNGPFAYLLTPCKTSECFHLLQNVSDLFSGQCFSGFRMIGFPVEGKTVSTKQKTQPVRL